MPASGAMLAQMAGGAAHAQTAPAPAAETAVQLNPFEVTAASDKGYSALNSNSITAFNLALDHAPITADIMDRTFLDDVGVLTLEEVLQQYDAGSAFAAGNVTNAAQNQPGDRGLRRRPRFAAATSTACRPLFTPR